MKKTLITLAALAATSATQAVAADVTTSGSDLGNGSDWVVGVGVTGSEAGFQQGDNVTVNNDFGVNLGQDITVGTLNVDALINLRPSGEYTLTTSIINVNENGKFNTFTDVSSRYDMNGGTMQVGGYWASNAASGNATVTVTVTGGWLDGDSTINVKNGSTLKINSLDNNDVVSTINAEAGSKIEINCDKNLGNGDWQTAPAISGAITLSGGSSVTGTGTLTFREGQISAKGENNTVSANLTADFDMNLDVEENGSLTISGAIQATEGNNHKVQKSGAGTLALSGSAYDTDLTMNINGGTLDLTQASDSLTLGNLYLANGTTLKLDDVQNFAGAITLGNNVTIDLTGWADLAMDEGIFTGVTALNGNNTVNIKYGEESWTAHLNLTSNGTVNIPEPTTATLSLLALAGLAARRRRK